VRNTIFSKTLFKDATQRLNSAKEYFKTDDDNKIYKAGWVDENGIGNQYKDIIISTTYKVLPLWHTRITGLSWLEKYGLWYPGGQLKNAATNMEYKKR
jgi:hypothetical protein